jgi:phosphoenolpyruvate carboxykinase (ATP)
MLARPKHDPRPYDVDMLVNPSQETLRQLALKHTPFVFESKFGNLCKIARNKARMAPCTYVLTDEDSSGYSHQTMSRSRGTEFIERQRKYILEKGKMLRLDGYYGTGENGNGAYPVQWLYTYEGANICGMQSVLSFPREAIESKESLEKDFDPMFRIVYTPDFFVDDLPKRQAILVDLENWTTYIMGADYFGESKKGCLRMLCDWVYQNGGLMLHAGAKAVTASGNTKAMTILGLSGTGKTTTTFSKQGEATQPIQDDMVAIWPEGRLTITENGCFAKTEGLTEKAEPVIYRGTHNADAWVENVYLTEGGEYDFFKGLLTKEEVARWKDTLIGTGAPAQNVEMVLSGEKSIEDCLDDNGVPLDGFDFVKWTGNGRSIIPMTAVEDAADLNAIPQVGSMGILNRDEGKDAAMPGILQFASPEQAAGYFMLGETSKTSAAGKETGKTRSPFTQPFFPRAHHLQAIRFSELAGTMPGIPMWEMNTGYIGGTQRDVDAGDALKVKIRHSSAMLEAMVTETIKWTKDPDFGYQVVDLDAEENKALVEAVGREILCPKTYFEANNRLEEYQTWVDKMKKEREAFLTKYDVAKPIVEATANRT